MSDAQDKDDSQTPDETPTGETSSDPETGGEPPLSADAPEADGAESEPEVDAAPESEVAEEPEEAAPEAQADAPAEEPDYAALAAELEDYERRSRDPEDHLTAPEAGSVTTDEQTDAAEPQPETKADPWFAPASTATFKADEPAVTASEPTTPLTPQRPQPVFVQAPEPPKKRGNRGAAALIGLLAAIVYAVLTFLALSIEQIIDHGTATITDDAIAIATSFELWVPTIVFWLGFWLLGVLVNRASWSSWVNLGIFVGVISYGGYLLGQLFDAPFWMLTSQEGSDLLAASVLSPIAIASFVFGREITIWFGAWVARRGARLRKANAEAQEEYERTLEAGPSLSA
ncbi:MAG: ABC transporter [Microbacterium sp.]